MRTSSTPTHLLSPIPPAHSADAAVGRFPVAHGTAGTTGPRYTDAVPSPDESGKEV